MQAIRRIAGQYHRAWNHHEPDAIRALFVEDGEILEPSIGAAVRGDGIGAYCRSLFARYPDLRFERIDESVMSGVTIAFQGRVRATARQRQGQWSAAREPSSCGPKGSGCSRRASSWRRRCSNLLGPRIALLIGFFGLFPALLQ